MVLLIALFPMCHHAHAQRAGSVDSSFQIGSGPTHTLRSLTVASDNKVLVGGDFNSWNGQPVEHLVRLFPNGELDTSFRAPANLQPYGLWEQTDRKILVAGYYFGEDRHLFRLNPNGSFDSSFQMSCDDIVRSLAFLPDGRLLIAGAFHEVNSVPRPGIAIIFSDGRLDASFAPADLIGPTASGGFAHALPDGRFLMVNARCQRPDGSFLSGLIRLSPAGAVDPLYNLGQASTYAKSILPHPNGGFILNSSFSSTRGLPNDGIDTHFTNSTASSGPTAVAVQPDGRILMADLSMRDENGATVTFLRTMADGKRDLSFRAELAGLPSFAAVRPDGKIIVAGHIAPAGQVPRPNVIALHANDLSAPPQIQWNASDMDAVHNGTLTFYITRSGDPSAAGTVSWRASIINGAATLTPSSGVITLPAGAMSAEVSFEISSDRATDLAFQLDLQDESGFAIGANRSLRVYSLRETGDFSLTADQVQTSEVAGQVAIGVARQTGAHLPSHVAWRFEPETNPAADLTLANGVVYFAAGQTNAYFYTRTIDDPFVGGSRDHTFEIEALDADFPVAGRTRGTLRILEDDLPGVPGLGADEPAFEFVRLADGGSLAVGWFTRFNGVFTPNLALLSPAGFVNTNFLVRISSAPLAAAELLDGKFLIAGAFTNVNGIARSQLARLQRDGSLDAAFTLSASFASAPVAIAAASDGSYLAAGSSSWRPFNGEVNNVSRGIIARVLPDGTVDPAFQTFTAGSAKLLALADGRFYAYGGVKAAATPYIRYQPEPPAVRMAIIRFNLDGSIDESFNVRIPYTDSPWGPANAPSVLSPLPNGRLFTAGSFTNVNLQAAKGVAILNQDGTLDLDFLANANAARNDAGAVGTACVSPDGRILLTGSGPLGRPYIFFLNPNGTLISQSPLQLLGGAATPISGGRFLFSAGLLRIGSEARPKLAIFDRDGRLEPLPKTAFYPPTLLAGQLSASIWSLAEGTFELQQTRDFITWETVGPVHLMTGEQSIPLPLDLQSKFFHLR